MTQLSFTTLIITAFCSACVDKKVFVQNSPTFKNFEISYTNGWTKSFTLTLDSSKIYFSPQRLYTVYYGILPDSLIDLMSTTYAKIRDSKITYTNEGCVDCPILAIKIVAGGDTTHISQTGDLNKIFYPLINSIQTFINTNRHQTIQAVFFLDTKSFTIPLPPKIDDTKFNPPAIVPQKAAGNIGFCASRRPINAF